MMRRIYPLAIALILSVCYNTNLMAATTFTVNKLGAGSPDFTDLSACLSAINTTDTYTVQFTDTAATQYDLSPAEITLFDGAKVTFAPTTPGVVSVHGRLNVAQGGGTFAASDMSFQVQGSQWVFLHGYDGQTYTNCTFGPGNDNGVVFRGGVNTVTNCTFTGVTNSPLIASGGITNVNNCTWTNCGRCALSESTGDTDPTHGLWINGGSATALQFGYAFVVTGFRATVNDFTSTGFATAITHDWENNPGGGAGWFTANNCQFRQVYDRAIAYYQNSPDSANYGTTITLNNCLVQNRSNTSSDVVVMDARGNGGNGVIILNNSTIQHLNPADVASAVVAWAGGTIIANNTVIDGTSNGIICTSQNSGFWTTVKLNHCVIVNTKTQAAVADDMANVRLWVRNTIVDASNASGINAPGSLSEKLVDYNLINVSGSFDGTHIATGNPAFVDPANGNYRIGPTSAARGKGTPTELLLDVDGTLYDSVHPDIGINQVAGALPTPTPGPASATAYWGVYP